ncbi:MAG: rRNA maturation RNase YbeY [Candidatus Promineifilaceae bacterium]|jgi:probable rRNA maturation factor
MSLVLEIQIETAVPQGTEDALRSAANAVFLYENISSASLTILLAGDDLLQDLNRRYRSQDRATDVLSFPFDDQGLPDLQDDVYIGDIAISVPYAQRQADDRGHNVTAELQLLAVHGILHLLGYDHEDFAQKSEMWAVQRSVLDQLGLAHVEPTEE